MPVTRRYWHTLDLSTCLAIRQFYREGRSMRSLATQYGIARTTVGNIVAGRTRPVEGLPNISRGPGRPRKGG